MNTNRGGTIITQRNSPNNRNNRITPKAMT